MKKSGRKELPFSITNHVTQSKRPSILFDVPFDVSFHVPYPYGEEGSP
jgi:hypothetical protein